MNNQDKNRDIDRLIDDIVDDKEAAGKLKQKLHQMDEPERKYTSAASTQESDDDPWDNMPV